MIDWKKLEGTNIYSFTIAGKMDKKGMEELTELFKIKRKEKEKFNILGNFVDLKGIEDFQTVIEGIKVDIQALGNMGNIDKSAILSDKKWMEKIVKVEKILIPGIKIKVYPHDEKAEAIRWLKE